jgi:predicted enzyme related to lactoylglutathione lyase
MTDTSTTVPFPRPPKRFPARDLHGRVRTAMLTYQDRERFKRFCSNVFGWDMFVLPSTAGGADMASENPSLVLATGPAYETWEGIVPGHMTAQAHHDPTGEGHPGLFMEIHMDRPISETVATIEALGGTVIGERPDDDRDDWNSMVTVADPSGNILTLWKCPSSRTWDEPESGYDKDEE